MAQAGSTIRGDFAVEAALLFAPIAAILVARVATYSAVAAEYPRISAMLFLWIAADALALAMIAKAPRNRPGIRAIVGAVAVASLIVPITAADPVRAALFSMPAVITAMGLTVTVFFGWTAARAFQVWRNTGSAEAVFSEILPPKLARFVQAELSAVWLGLFRWNTPADVPPGAQAFAYHTYLTPMLATFVALQLIELSVVHLLVSLWNETVALILLALSVWGVIWMVALMKSFRINPVLLMEDGVRVRSGIIIDEFIPFSSISGTVAAFDTARLKEKRTLNLAIMSSPNVCIELSRPITRVTVFGTKQEVNAVGLRLDEAGAFHAALTRHLA